MSSIKFWVRIAFAVFLFFVGIEIVVPFFRDFHGDIQAFWRHGNFPVVSFSFVVARLLVSILAYVLTRITIEKAKQFKAGEKESEAVSFGWSLMSAREAVTALKRNPNADIEKLQEVVEMRSLAQCEAKWLCRLAVEVPEVDFSSIVDTLQMMENSGQVGVIEEFFEFLRSNAPEVLERGTTGVAL